MILKLVKLLMVVVVSCASADLTKHEHSSTSAEPNHSPPLKIPSKTLEQPEESAFSRNLNIESPILVENFDTEDHLSSIPARVDTPGSENLLEGSGGEDDLKGDATFWWPRFYLSYPRYYWDYNRPRYYYGPSRYYW